MIQSMFSAIDEWFGPVLGAFFKPGIPWKLRWRLLILQPVTWLSNAIGVFPYLLSRPYTVHYLPVAPGRSLRALVFKAPGTGRGRRLRPLHVDIHGGAFIGGLPENTAAFDERIAKETGAVVISISYRTAPAHPFPGAIDDVDATIKWLRENAEERWGADPMLMTTGGTSAGGNLAVAATQQPGCQWPSPTAIKAIVTFYAPLDLRLRPVEKPRSRNMPKNDPFAVLLPLYDAYAGPARAENLENPRMSPALAKRETLPNRIFVGIAATDILVAELEAFAERVNQEDTENGDAPRVEVFYHEEAFHGYLELPDFVVKDLKKKAFDRGLKVLSETYAEHGWTWEV